ncbi:MAG: SOS response-associated peptidase [Saprospiraceae bacterium]
MCKRYSLIIDKAKILEQFGIETNQSLKTSYNVSPCDFAYVITNEQPRALTRMTWGLIPKFSKTGENTGRLINARVEGIQTSSSFRIPIRRTRCLVIADSYYEWKTEGLKKWPFRIVNPDKTLLAIAGVWDEWESKNETIRSFSIITKPTEKSVKHISDRMPLILDSTALQDLWLDQVNLDDIFEIVNESETGNLKCYPISQKVNIKGYSSQELHEELAS